MTLEQFKIATKERQNEFLKGFKELKDNISDYIVNGKNIRYYEFPSNS